MKPATKLKVAAEDIKEILKKYDIAASIVLHTPGHGEYLNVLNTSYSCAYQYNDRELRFYNKASDYKTPEEAKKKLEDTNNMLAVLTDLTCHNFVGLKYYTEELEKITKPIHSKGKFT